MAQRERTESRGGGGPTVDFDDAWPRARASAAAALGARGVQRADADDLLQDVAVRALRHSDRFVSEEHMARWCRRVALNLHVDGVRRGRRISPLPLPDAPSTDDMATAVERRIALSRLAAGVAALSPDDRRLLFDPAPATSRQEAVRLAVRRHRLRARLAALVEGMTAGVAFVRRLPKLRSSPVKAAVVAAPLVAATLLLGPLGIAPPVDRPGPTAGPHANDRLAVAASEPAPPAPHTPAAPSHAAAPHGAGPVTTSTATAPPVRTVVRVEAAGQPVAVRHWHNEADLSVCTDGVVDACVRHPRPQVPPTTTPPVTLPGG